MPTPDVSESVPDWLRLPPRRPFRAPGASAKYGASHVAARYCGRQNQHFCSDEFVWAHGWRPDHTTTVDPVYTASVSLNPGPSRILVGRELEADFLRSHGYDNSRAIGMPICYTDNPPVSRRPGSLLVVPVHSLETTQHDWAFQQYADLIAATAKDFDDVVVCLHPGCIKNGYWLEEFEALKLPWVSGADVFDANSLDRMRYLCSQFEYVTTNGLTSTIAFASADGAKVSIFGPFCEIKVSDVEEVQFYQQNPGLAQRVFPQLQEDAVRQHLGSFFCHPAAATESRDWGRKQLGYDSILPPDELGDVLFGASTNTTRGNTAGNNETAERRSHQAFSKIRNRLNDSIKPDRRNQSASQSASDPDRTAEEDRLRKLPRNQPGTASIGNQSFHFSDAQTFLTEYAQVFDNENLFFPCIYADPCIMHLGAGNGLAERYWLSRHPQARILSYQSNSTRYALLRQNLAEQVNNQVVLYDAQSWPGLRNLGDSTIEFLVADADHVDIDELTNETEILGRTRRLRIACNSRIDQAQRLSVIVGALERNGFRYHIVPAPQSSSPRPLVHLKALDGVDMRLIIWGYRGSKFPKTLDRSSE